MKNKNVSSTEELPTLEVAVNRLMKHGTVLTFPGSEVKFSNPLSPVKSLEVTMSSTESRDMRVLHKLHTITRSTV